MTVNQIYTLPKINLHEHLDCSVRPSTLLEFWKDSSQEPPFSNEFIQNPAAYQQWVAKFAKESLPNYLTAIVDHVLPVMQTSHQLTRITQENVYDAVQDGVIGLEIRFAPQLHQQKELTLTQVLESVIQGLESSPIPVHLIVCGLRHENHDTVQEVVHAASEYPQWIRGFDLAGDETNYPGVLEWWEPLAIYARETGLGVTIHLGETQTIYDSDLQKLKNMGIKRLGHGVRGTNQTDFFLEACPTSNVVTGQVLNICSHPIDALYKNGFKVTVNSDGTLFTESTLSNEYKQLQECFGWGLPEFYKINQNAIEASFFSDDIKFDLQMKLKEGFLQHGFQGH